MGGSLTQPSASHVATEQLDLTQPEYLTREEARVFLRLGNVRVLDKLVRKGDGPPKIKLTRKQTLYPRAGLIEWLNQHQVSGRPLPGPKKRRGRPLGSRQQKRDTK
jgi:hypothetical protein